MRRRESGQVESLLEYGEQTAGRIMNPQVFALSEDLTVGEAITALQSSRDVEMVFYLYVVDAAPAPGWRDLAAPAAAGVARNAAQADHDARRHRACASTPIRKKSRGMVASYNLLAVPVVDEENKLVGIVTVDDVIDVIKDEATEDLLRLAGVSGDERVATPRE